VIQQDYGNGMPIQHLLITIKLLRCYSYKSICISEVSTYLTRSCVTVNLPESTDYGGCQAAHQMKKEKRKKLETEWLKHTSMHTHKHAHTSENVTWILM